MVLTLRVFESPKKLKEEMAKVINVPEFVVITDCSAGVINAGQEHELQWGNLTAVDSQLYDKFSSIGQEQFCPTFKIKLKNYQGEDLTTLVGSEMSLRNYEIDFVYDKFKQVIGFALVVEYSELV